MLEKLSFPELVRYFFSGSVVALGAGLANRLTPADVAEWAKTNSWAGGFSPAAVGATVLLLIGYCSFTIYRTVAYEWIVVPLKAGLARLPRIGRFFYSYRELIQKILKDQGVTKGVTTWEAERLYRVLRRKVAPEFYPEVQTRVTAGLHFLYFISLVLLVSFAYATNWRAVVGSVAFLLLALVIDAYFEREELLYFLAKRGDLEEALAIFRNHPVWPKA